MGPATAPPGAPGTTAAGEVLTQRQAVDLLIRNLDGAEATIEDRERRLEVMLHLAATGLAAERVVHEFGRQARAAVDALAEVRRLLRPADRTGGAMTSLEAALQTLRNEFRVLAPYEVTERAQRTRNTRVREMADLALTLNRAELTGAGITASVDGADFVVKVRPSSLLQVLDNLVHNACYWVGVQGEGHPRRISLILAAEEGKVLVVDTGPGISEEAGNHVFEPFFSMRSGGKGLGLHISAELMRNLCGRLRLARPEDAHLAPEWATGATLVVEFDPEVRVVKTPKEKEEQDRGA